MSAEQPHRWVYSRDDVPSTEAFDTETYKGILKVVCTPTEFFEPIGPPKSEMRALTLLDWLWEHTREVNWLWNLAFDRDVILRTVLEPMLAKEEAHIETDEDDDEVGSFLVEHVLHFHDYIIKTVGSKSWSIQRKGSKQKRTFFDAGVFYRTENERSVPLDTAAHEVLGFGKNAEELGIDRVRIGTEEGYYEAHRDLIIKYCMRDSELTKKLGDGLFPIAKDALGFYPRRWASPASLAKAWLERHAEDLMTRQRGPRNQHDPFHHCYRGGIFTSQLGLVENVDEVDIVNAYGSALLHMPKLSDLTEPVRTDRYSSDAVMGSYYILIDYDGRLPARKQDALGLPLRPEKKEIERIIYPNSRGKLRPYYADRVEMEFFIERGRRFEILMAHEMFPRDPNKKVGLQFPQLSRILQRVAELKAAAKKGDVRAKMVRTFLKAVVNSTYGATAEAKFGETPFTNWVAASFITAWCRRLIWREWAAIEDAGGKVISVNTDSIRYIAGKYRVPVTQHGEIGKFEFKFTRCETIHYQSGIAIVRHRKGHDETCGECKTLPRLCQRNGRWELHPADCACCVNDGFGAYVRKRGLPALTADMLMNQRGTELKVPIKRALHYTEGLIQDRMNEVGDICGPRDEKDGVKWRPIRLDANLAVFDIDPNLLKFEVLCRQPVPCLPPAYDDVMFGGWREDRTELRRDLFGTNPTVDMTRMKETARWVQTVAPECTPELVASDLGDCGLPFTPGIVTPPRGPRPTKLLRETVFPPPISGTTRHVPKMEPERSR